jgi:hypothetical protein
MEENVLPVQPTFKLYNDRAIYIGTFLGGPLVAGYLAAENFKQLGQPGKVQASWAIGICATVLLFGAAFLIPGMEKVPNFIIPLIYTGIAQLLVQRFQGPAIKTHLTAGGQTFSPWRAVLIGVIGLAILLVTVFAIIMLTGPEIIQ